MGRDGCASIIMMMLVLTLIKISIMMIIILMMMTIIITDDNNYDGYTLGQFLQKIIQEDYMELYQKQTTYT